MVIRLLFVLGLVTIVSASCFLAYIALAQEIVQDVGTPSCEAFDDLQGNHCYKIKCDPQPHQWSEYRSCDDKEISNALDSTFDCEMPNVTIQNHISCNTAPDPPGTPPAISWSVD